MESFRFLGTTISQDLKWDIHIDSHCKKAQRLYFLHRLKKLNLPQAQMIQFYSAVIESVLCSSGAVWFGSASKSDLRRQQRTVKTALWLSYSASMRDSKRETISSQSISTIQRCAHMTRASPYHITDTVMPTIRQATEQLDTTVTITNSQGTLCGVYRKGTVDMRWVWNCRTWWKGWMVWPLFAFHIRHIWIW